MTKIWIETISKESIGDLVYYQNSDGELDAAYYIQADGKEYVEENKNYLLNFLLQQNKYPLFITFIVYDGQAEEYSDLLKENNIDFRLTYLEVKETYYNLLGRHQYNPPCFTATVKDSSSLTILLNETFWIPAQNEYYSISYSDNLFFKIEENTVWGRKRKRSLATFKIEEETTIISIFHDGAGFYVISNESKYSTLDNFISNLPKGTDITQINDTLITENNDGDKIS